MKKLCILSLTILLSLFCLTGCSGGEVPPSGSDGNQSEVTLYANGGIFLIGAENLEEVELSASTMDAGTTFSAGIGSVFSSIEKEGAVFSGWTLYAVTDGEWVQEEVTELEDGQLCVPCGDYGYYFMRDYEVVYENASTDELMAFTSDGRDYYGIVNWN